MGHWAEGAKRDFDRARGWRKHGLMVADDDADAAAGRAKADAAAESIDEQYAALARACEARDRGRTGELPLAQVRGGGGGGRRAPRRGGDQDAAPAGAEAARPAESDRNRSGEHWDSPIFDVVDHREFVQALRWHAMQARGAGAEEILNAELELLRTRGATSSSTACTPTRRSARRVAPDDGWATTGRG